MTTKVKWCQQQRKDKPEFNEDIITLPNRLVHRNISLKNPKTIVHLLNSAMALSDYDRTILADLINSL